jgi:DNA-binding response OmpR family regulator
MADTYRHRGPVQSFETAICTALEPMALVAPGADQCQRHVLLIEDDEDLMMLVKSTLARFGKQQYCLIWAKTLHEGLTEALDANIDLVLLDLGLPDSDGSTSYAWVRAAVHEVPIIVLTANESEETKDEVVASGATNYLLKQTISGPLLVLAMEAALLNADQPVKDLLTTQNTDSCRVLLIEDDEDAMLLVRYALAEHGGGRFCMEWSCSLQAGIDRLSTGGVDLVLLDLGLPDSSGAAAYLELNKMAPDLPIIVLTGATSMEMEFALLATGADDYLDKCTTSGSELIQSLAGVLADAKLRGQREWQGRSSVSNTWWGV